MRIFATARKSVDTLIPLFQNTARARTELERRRQQTPAPRQVKVVIKGPGMIQLHDADTGAVLGYRTDYREALWTAQAMERDASLSRELQT